jgi:hypothetical protein
MSVTRRKTDDTCFCSVSTEGPLFKAINPEFQSGNWFTSESIDQMQLYRMLIRAMMIRTDADSR